MKRKYNLIFAIIFFVVFIARGSSRERKKRVLLHSRSTMRAPEALESTCKGIYAVGMEINGRMDIKVNIPKQEENLAFATIDPTGLPIFKFNMEIEKKDEYVQEGKIKEFFENRNFPPKYDWFELKECCLKEGNQIINEKNLKIFDDICTKMIYGFIQYRYSMMVKAVDLAFKNAMEGKDYILTQEADAVNVNEKDIQIMKDYQLSENSFIVELKKKLTAVNEKQDLGIKNVCESLTRLCPLYFNFDFSAYKDTPACSQDYDMDCLNDGYFLVCEKESKVMEYIENRNIDALRPISIKVYYFGSVTATSDFDFTIVTFQRSVAKNYRIQRLIVDNYNNKFQAEMMKKSKEIKEAERANQQPKKNQQSEQKQQMRQNQQPEQSQQSVIPTKTDYCLTTGDCLDTNAYLTGFIEGSLKTGRYTDNYEIDKDIQNDFQARCSEYSESVFVTSTALGLMSMSNLLLEFYHIPGFNIPKLSIKYQFQYILNQFLLSVQNEEHKKLVSDIYQVIETCITVSKQSVADDDAPYKGIELQLGVDSLEELMSLTTEYVTLINTNLQKIYGIQDNLIKPLMLDDKGSSYLKSKNYNEEYTYLAMASVENLYKKTSSDFQILEKMTKFTLLQGVGLMYANEAYFNLGGIKFQTKSRKAFLTCETALDSNFMMMGFDLLHFFEIYPKKDVENLYKRGDGLLKLGKYFMRMMDMVKSPCTLRFKIHPVGIYREYFRKNKIYFLNYKIFDEKLLLAGVKIGKEGQYIEAKHFYSPDSKGEIRAPITDQEQYFMNLRVLDYYSQKSMKLKKKYGLQPVVLYSKVIELEKNVLKHFKGYVEGDKGQSIEYLYETLVKLSTDMFLVSTISLLSWKKKLQYIIDKTKDFDDRMDVVQKYGIKINGLKDDIENYIEIKDPLYKKTSLGGIFDKKLKRMSKSVLRKNKAKSKKI